jgi:hypothetical protein
MGLWIEPSKPFKENKNKNKERSSQPLYHFTF